jgi:hypothetical protein
MGIMKSFVRNRCRPEGSIAEGYVALECLTFCSRYLKDIETKFTRQAMWPSAALNPVHDGGFSIFSATGTPLGGAVQREMSNKEWGQCHLYVLNQCEEVAPYIE